DAGGLVTRLADLAGIVRGEERADHELAGPDRPDARAGLLDDTGVLVAHRGRPGYGLDPAVGPQVRAAHAGRREPDDGIGGLFDLRVFAPLDADIPGGIEHSSAHDAFLSLNREG